MKEAKHARVEHRRQILPGPGWHQRCRGAQFVRRGSLPVVDFTPAARTILRHGRLSGVPGNH